MMTDGHRVKHAWGFGGEGVRERTELIRFRFWPETINLRPSSKVRRKVLPFPL